jgi:hypothetical protein
MGNCGKNQVIKIQLQPDGDRNGEEMPLSMAQGLADIGWISQSDIIFGNPGT